MSSFDRNTVLIIAEVGSNHDGDLACAMEHVDAAAESGADVVKFQSFLADEMVALDDPSHAMLKKLEIPREWYPALMERCAERGVRFLSTATNFTTLGWMEEFGAWGYKVASCNLTYAPLVDRLMQLGKPVIFSGGLATLDEIRSLAKSLRDRGFNDFAVMHCVSLYPAPADKLNLGVIPRLKQLLDCPVGYSDHSMGIEAPIAAVALGACIVEKHFSLIGSGFSPDHEVSLRPEDFAAMCRAIRNTRAAMGNSLNPDSSMMYSMRRSLHYSRGLKAGDIITMDDLKVTRPEDGMVPGEMEKVVGRRLSRDANADEPVRADMLMPVRTDGRH